MARKKKEPTHSSRLGASFRAGTKMIEVLSPVTDETVNSIKARNFKTLPANIKSKAWTTGYGANLVIATADAALDTKMGHSGALSRGSITAWVPEVIRGADALAAGAGAHGGKMDGRAAHAAFVESGTGFNPQSGTWSIAPRTIAYQGAKRVGQIIRRLASTSTGGKVFGPVKKGLAMLGAHL